MPGAGRLSLAFFLSGAAGLIFQVVWFYRAGLAFGNGVWAITVVLSSFMAGLALGSILAGRLARRISQPLRTYAALEAVVALFGLATTWALPLLTTILTPLGAITGSSTVLQNLIRVGAAFAVLAVPATAMGATLPVAVSALSRLIAGRDGREAVPFGRVLGHLYGWNTLGAVAGVVTAELFLVARVGISGTAVAAALLDLAAATIALRLSRQVGEPAADPPVVATRPDRSPLVARSVPGRRATRLLLVCAFLSGGTLLALEVMWFRFLTMYVLRRRWRRV